MFNGGESIDTSPKTVWVSSVPKSERQRQHQRANEKGLGKLGRAGGRGALVPHKMASSIAGDIHPFGVRQSDRTPDTSFNFGFCRIDIGKLPNRTAIGQNSRWL